MLQDNLTRNCFVKSSLRCRDQLIGQDWAKRFERIAKMGYVSLVFLLLLCASSLVTCVGASKPLPSVYIQIDFKYTWSELCLLESYFKTKLSEKIIKDDGTTIMASQVYLYNFDENCSDAKERTEDASLLFYVIKPGGTYEDVDEELTKDAFKILHNLVENKLGRLLGQLFELKIKKVQAKGWNAPPKPAGFTELERTYIAIGIALGVLATIVLLTIAVYYCKQQRMEVNHRPISNPYGNAGEKLEIVESPPQNYNLYGEQPSFAVTETKF